MKFYAYLRVSGAGQIDGDGPERQSKAIDDFLKANTSDREIEEYFFDKGVSGTVDGMDRPDFVRLLAKCQPGDAIVVERLDRLARELMVQEIMLAECRKRGIGVFASDQHMQDQADTGADPTRKLIRQVIGAMAEWEKAVITLKLQKARERKRAATGKCEGAKPYGQYPGEHQILETVTKMHAEGYGYQFIAHCLNGGGMKTRRGTPWSKDSIRDLLTRRGQVCGCTQGRTCTNEEEGRDMK